jgi:hypothetical protein
MHVKIWNDPLIMEMQCAECTKLRSIALKPVTEFIVLYLSHLASSLLILLSVFNIDLANLHFSDESL